MSEILTKTRVFLLAVLALLFAQQDFSVHAQSRAQRGSIAPATESPPLGKSTTEKQILAVLDDLDRNQRLRNLTVPAEDARLLRLLTESINVKHVVELGTANVSIAVDRQISKGLHVFPPPTSPYVHQVQR